MLKGGLCHLRALFDVFERILKQQGAAYLK